MRRNIGSSNLSTEANELYLWLTNDELWEKNEQIFHKNLATKKAKGVYNHQLAIKLFMYLVDRAELKYEFDNVNRRGKRYWHEMKASDLNKAGRIFTKQDKLEVAERLVDDFEGEYDLGNYDNYLPKKYQNPKNRLGKIPKTVSEIVVQQHYGQGWEDVYSASDRAEAIRIKKDYTSNTNYPTRIINRRVKNPAYIGSVESDNFDNAIY